MRLTIGAGIVSVYAALSAAVSAHENGARVLVLEKAPRDMRGGNTHWAGAVLRIAFDDPHDLEPLLPGIDTVLQVDPFQCSTYGLVLDAWVLPTAQASVLLIAATLVMLPVTDDA